MTDGNQPVSTADRGYVAAQSRPMAGSLSQRYSRFVGMMKVFLPALAATLVIVVIAWPGAFDQDDGFHLSFSKMQADGADRLSMLNPRYYGTDKENRPFTVTAKEAVQDADDSRQVTLSDLQADMTMNDGTWISMMANQGVYHQATMILRLTGAISIFSDRGYEFHASVADVDFSDGSARSARPVSGHGPFGSLRADRMQIEDRGQRMLFEGNVKMTLNPQAQG